MKYPNNDLWSVRQIEFLYDALHGYENKKCIYYVNKKVQTNIPDIATYNYIGVIVIENEDRTIMFEQGTDYGLKFDEIISLLKYKNITYEIRE